MQGMVIRWPPRSSTLTNAFPNTQKKGTRKNKRAKGSSSDDPLSCESGALIVTEDRTSQKDATLGRSVTWKFFANFHEGYNPVCKGDVYQLIEPHSIGFPETSIVCR